MQNNIYQNIIKNIIEAVRNNEMTTEDTIKFVHIELGKKLVYNNDYSSNLVNKEIDDKESDITNSSKIRRETLRKQATKLDSYEQVCKGLAEISTATFNELGIKARTVRS